MTDVNDVLDFEEETTLDSPDDPTAVADEGIKLQTELDLAAAILYLVFNVAEAVVPVTVFYTLIDPFVSQWSGSYNSVYKAAWYLLWIGNMVVYGIPAVVGGFTWMWNIYVVGGYIAWNQYMVVWGGTILQFIDMIMFIVAAAVY